MVNRVIGYLGRPPHVLHRLDMDTSGLLLFTKTQAAARDVSLQFRWGLDIELGLDGSGNNGKGARHCRGIALSPKGRWKTPKLVGAGNHVAHLTARVLLLDFALCRNPFS